MTSVEIETLKSVVNRMFDAWKNSGVDKFEFEDDFYWNISLVELVDLSVDPHLTIGSINDDVQFVQRLFKDPYVSNALELERIASIFRFIARSLKLYPSDGNAEMKDSEESVN